MTNHIINIQELRFVTVFKYVCKYLSWANYFFVIYFILTISINLLIDSNLYLLSIIYFVGILLSLSIHEYMHLLVIKKIKPHSKVIIRINWAKFTIIPFEPLKGGDSIIVACSGPIFCVLISLLLLLIREYLIPDSIMILLSAICYGFHGICLLPIYGDGLMVLKGINDLIKGGEFND